MNEAAKELIQRMQSDIDHYGWSAAGDEIDLEAKYRATIEEVGAVPFLAELFLQFGDSTLASWLMFLSFAWKDLPFTAWKEVLYRISWNDPAGYQFVWFATQNLGLDIRRIIRQDPHVDEVARDLVARVFSGRSSPPGSRATIEALAEHGVDAVRMWRRLASEGAPMAVDLDQLGDT
jgi:hypothetical protein